MFRSFGHFIICLCKQWVLRHQTKIKAEAMLGDYTDAVQTTVLTKDNYAGGLTVRLGSAFAKYVSCLFMYLSRRPC
jgi:hypothetical protein